MWYVPLAVLLKWPLPNYINPETRGSEVWAVSFIFLILSTICVGLRLYTRVFVRKWIGPDDLLILIAYLSTVAVTACVAVGNAHYDWDRHAYDIPIPLFSSSIKMFYITKIFWSIATSLVRLSVLCLYYRLISRCNAPARYIYTLHAMTFVTIALLICYLFVNIFPCNPISLYWSWPPTADSNCINDGTWMMATAIINTLSEAIIALLPILAVYRLRVAPHQRWSIIGLLSLGFFVAVAGAFRTFYIWKTVTTYDMSWWAAPHWICSEVEINMALISACAAPLKPVITRILKKRRSSFLPFAHTSRLATRSSYSTLSRLSQKSAKDAKRGDSWTNSTPPSYTNIDLEGIDRHDGLGYSVKITGPPRPERTGKLRKRFRPVKLSIPLKTASVSRKMSLSSAGSWTLDRRQDVFAETTISISESWERENARQGTR
ncbi:hypothetical protein BT63DRAFT_457739 [Microthyrium microscopicum]|uniref:Rhodopsin domain-containing protein n=1 Tax=Microthyrium microscopicum TaxID=703497 RepID=A0A6A6U672_9PEZI|nr:hypothetical protein BT63DRAFT_457739 [Microthyrium microscopicum]